jgi:hypothetical protein
LTHHWITFTAYVRFDALISMPISVGLS